jgi:hypothetical protein
MRAGRHKTSITEFDIFLAGPKSRSIERLLKRLTEAKFSTTAPRDVKP